MQLLAATGTTEPGSIPPATTVTPVARPAAHNRVNPKVHKNLRSPALPLAMALLVSLLLHVALLLLSHTQPQTRSIHAGTPLTLSIQPASAAAASATKVMPQQPLATAEQQSREASVQELLPPTPAHTLPAPPTAATAAQPLDTRPVIKESTEIKSAVRQDSETRPTSRSQTSIPTSTTTATTASTPAATRTLAQQGDSPRDSVAQKLQTSLGIQFAHAFHYPRMAQRRGWQGKVTLGLRVEADGQLSNIHLVETSGYTLLDNDALNTLRRVARLPEARQWLQERHLNMVLPVEYRLIDG